MATTALLTTPTFRTVADLLKRLGDVPPDRVLLHPTPGTATERDVEAIHNRENRLCELVDGVLVEKDMGFAESRFAVVLIGLLIEFLWGSDRGPVLGADGTVQLFPGLVRIPDVSFVSWERYPQQRTRRRAAIPDLAPDLAVEVLSKGNTRKEMERQLGEYFRAGVRLVWCADARARTVRVYTAPDRSVLLREEDPLEGGDVLPGFRLSIRDGLAEAERQGPRPGPDSPAT